MKAAAAALPSEGLGGASMEPKTRVDIFVARLVATIGSQLNCGIFPEVFDGGFVAPSASAIPFPMGAENVYVGKQAAGDPLGSRASGTGPWTRSSRAGTAAARASGSASQVERTDVQSLY